MLISLSILPAMDPSQRPILTGPLECDANPTGLSIEPKSFKIGFRIRDKERLRKCFEQQRKQQSIWRFRWKMNASRVDSEML
jgi:phenylacetate 2-hydroxylase